jgi:hypothetical protein
MKINELDQTLEKVRDMRERNRIFLRKKGLPRHSGRVFWKNPQVTKHYPISTYIEENKIKSTIMVNIKIYSNILPQTQGGGDVDANLSLKTRSRNRLGGCALVNTSAN